MARRMAGDVDVLRLLAEDRGGRDEQRSTDVLVGRGSGL